MTYPFNNVYREDSYLTPLGRPLRPRSDPQRKRGEALIYGRRLTPSRRASRRYTWLRVLAADSIEVTGTNGARLVAVGCRGRCRMVTLAAMMRTRPQILHSDWTLTDHGWNLRTMFFR